MKYNIIIKRGSLNSGVLTKETMNMNVCVRNAEERTRAENQAVDGTSAWRGCQAGLSPLKHTPLDSSDIDRAPYYTD